jgi:hypothetical protein
MRLSLSLSAAVLGLVSLVRASNVIDLDTKNFDKVRAPATRGMWMLTGVDRWR